MLIHNLVICFELYTYGKRKQVLWDTKFYLNQLFKDTKQIHTLRKRGEIQTVTVLIGGKPY